MDDVFDTLFKPIFRVILLVLRALLFVGYDLCVQIIGWSIGWYVLRAITFGAYPKERLGEVESAGWFTEIFVEVIGLLTIAAAILVLMKVIDG